MSRPLAQWQVSSFQASFEVPLLMPCLQTTFAVAFLYFLPTRLLVPQMRTSARNCRRCPWTQRRLRCIVAWLPRHPVLSLVRFLSLRRCRARLIRFPHLLRAGVVRVFLLSFLLVHCPP